MPGWIKLYRKLIDSEIMKKPPMYLKVFIWLLLHAQHSNFNGLKRGQGKTSIPDIIEAMSYKIGYRIERPTKKEIYGIIDWLRSPYEGNDEGNMMVTTKVTHGFIYDIVKYELYQDDDEREGNDENPTKVQRRSRQGNNINKNVKNDKNDKNILSNDNIVNLPIDVIPYQEIMNLFNKTCKTLPSIKSIEGTRQQTVRVLWKEIKSIEYFENLFNEVNYSDFLSGRNGKWMNCNFDWILKQSNRRKIMEGVYKNKDVTSSW